MSNEKQAHLGASAYDQLAESMQSISMNKPLSRPVLEIVSLLDLVLVEVSSTRAM